MEELGQKAPVSRVMPLLPGLKERVQNELLCAADARGGGGGVFPGLMGREGWRKEMTA